MARVRSRRAAPAGRRWGQHQHIRAGGGAPLFDSSLTSGFGCVARWGKLTPAEPASTLPLVFEDEVVVQNLRGRGACFYASVGLAAACLGLRTSLGEARLALHPHPWLQPAAPLVANLIGRHPLRREPNLLRQGEDRVEVPSFESFELPKPITPLWSMNAPTGPAFLEPRPQFRTRCGGDEGYADGEPVAELDSALSRRRPWLEAATSRGPRSLSGRLTEGPLGPSAVRHHRRGPRRAGGGLSNESAAPAGLGSVPIKACG